MTKKNMIIAIVAFVIGCIVCSMSMTNMYHQQIDDLSSQLEQANTKYNDMYNVSEILVQDFVDYTEEKYDELVDFADEMAYDLDDNGLDVPAYDDRYFMDVQDDWLEHVDPYMEFIVEKCNLD